MLSLDQESRLSEDVFGGGTIVAPIESDLFRLCTDRGWYCQVGGPHTLRREPERWEGLVMWGEGEEDVVTAFAGDARDALGLALLAALRRDAA
jgi:hypothetical protein